jgi:hypothetical protein
LQIPTKFTQIAIFGFLLATLVDCGENSVEELENKQTLAVRVS